MNHWFRNFVLFALMLATGGLAFALRPTQLLAEQDPKMNLEAMVPHSFGKWRELPQSSAQIINPQETELLNKLYSQILSRVYIDQEGAMMMLSIAYGANQSDGVALHYPEVCYPSQGFQVLSNTPASLATGFGKIKVKHLFTKIQERPEAVTYWSTLGEQVVDRGLETKLAQIKYGFSGVIPDGLIFRVSSIDENEPQTFLRQERFVDELLSSMSPVARRRFVGPPSISAAPSPNR